MRWEAWSWPRWRGSVGFLALAIVVFLSVVSLAPRYREVAAQVFLVVTAAVVIRLLVVAVVEATSHPGPFAFDRALVPPPPRELTAPSEPARIRFEVGAATHRSMELHHQLRRRLRRLAEDRLGADHGVDIDADPDAARTLLGEEAWDLLRPDLTPPSDRFGPGMPIEGITRIVTAVEELSR
jgi:hypothetical protein